MLAVAGVLLYLNVRSPVARSFALFLILRAIVLVLYRIGYFAPRFRDVLFQDVVHYFTLALAPILFYFLVVYVWAKKKIFVAVAATILVASTFVMEALYAWRHDLVYSILDDNRGDFGPLAPFTSLYILVMGIAGLVFAFLSSSRPGPLGRAAFIVSVGFSLNALLDGANALFEIATNGFDGYVDRNVDGLWMRLFYGVQAAAGVVTIVTIVLYSRGLGRGPDWARRVGTAYGLASLVVLTSAFIVFGPERLDAQKVLLTGFWRLLLPALIAYAIVRHRLFGLDLKVKWTLGKGAVGAVFVAVFLTVSQLIQNLTSANFGIVGGAMAAGLLLFAIRPLENLGERFAQAVLPHAKPVTSMSKAEGLRLFQDQATLVWADGLMGVKERLLLDNLRERLGIPMKTAQKIEHEVIRASKASPRGL